MSANVIAAIRTAVQALVGGAVAAAAGWLGGKLGIEIDTAAITEVIVLVIIGLVTWGLNALGERFPVINRIISLGASPATPSY